MKPTSSARSLTNGTNTQTARAVVPSPLAATSSVSRMSPSGRKNRSGSSNKPPAIAATPHGDGVYQYRSDGMSAMASSQDLLLQLQQLQHQQQLQHGMVSAGVPYGYPTAPSIQPMPGGYMSYMAQPPVVQRVPSGIMNALPGDDLSMRYAHTVQAGVISHGAASSTGMAADEGEDLTERIEKKDQMIAQLGSFLSQMKQESEGTAHAWKEKMQEIAELKRQVAGLAQQLKDSQEKEKQTAQQLAQVTEDVELAVQGLKESEAKHLEELKIMNDEIQRRQSEENRAKTEFQDTVRDLTEKLAHCTQQLDNQTHQCRSLEDTLQKMDDGHQIASKQLDEELKEATRQLADAHTQLQSMEQEKHELAQHLWNVTQALDQATNRERTLQAQLDETSKAMDQARADWSERVRGYEAEKVEMITAQSSLQTQVETALAQVQEERSQKEQINALMGEEMQRVGQDIQGLHQQYSAKLDQSQVEIEHWKNEATMLQEKLVRVEGQYVLTRKELDEWQARASQIDEECQLLQKTGNEKAYTLQEINEQLRQALGELHDTRLRMDQLQHHCESLEDGISQCVHLLPDRRTDTQDPVEEFPRNVLKVLEEWKQQAGHLEQIKLATLRLQQDRDIERERSRSREQELVQKSLTLQSEMESAKADATALAQELQELTQKVSGNDSKLSAQVQQLKKEIDESRAESGLQILQLQKALDSQKLRVQQLEGEKRDLLQEAEGMNATVESLYQAKNEKQVELDQLKTIWKELQAEHADLKESFEDVESNYERATVELNHRAKELQQLVQDLMSAKEQLEKDYCSCNESLTKLKVDFETLNRQYSADQFKWTEHERDSRQAIDEKSQRLEEMMEMLTQLRSRNEFLEQARNADDQNVRVEFDKFQQQLLALSQDKKRAEVAYTNAKAQLDQLMPELFTLKEEKRHYSQAHGELEDEVGNLKKEVARMQGELERSARARSALQLEMNRVTDEGQDVVRQFEVLRRDAKASEKKYHDELERLRKEYDDLRNESGESSAMVEELQTKMTSVQNAANATINELMSELQSLQDTMGYDKNKLQKENESLRSQVRAMEEDLRKKDADVKEIQTAYRMEKDSFSEKENELKTKLNRLSSALDAKKQEADRLSKELESKGLKTAEYERKINPLINARDNLQAKCNELKVAFDVKTREINEMEERCRDEVARSLKEKRDVETMYLAIKEEYELIKSHSSGQQQQWQSDLRAMKHNLERTKADLMKANAEVSSLSQRLESYQQNAQETISELATRLQGADQQKELAVNALQREVNLERERRRETEVQKMELQRLLRQRNPVQPPASTATVVTGSSFTDDGGAWGLTMPTPSSQRHPSLHNHEQPAHVRSTSAPETGSQPSQVEATKQLMSSTPAEYRKFYANEPMTNAELANLPMNLIKAQIGLDLAAPGGSKSPTKMTKSGPRGSTIPVSGDNNEDIPLLSFDKLPQNPEAHDDDSSPTCNNGNSSRILSDKRSGAVSLLESLSARSNSDRYVFDNTESSIRPQRNSSSSSLNSAMMNSSNTKKKQPSAKKKRPSVMPASSSAAAAAYANFSSSPAPTPSPPKMKSNSKLLPRIQQ